MYVNCDEALLATITNKLIDLLIAENFFLEATPGLTLKNTMTFQLRQQATTVLHTLKV